MARIWILISSFLLQHHLSLRLGTWYQRGTLPNFEAENVLVDSGQRTAFGWTGIRWTTYQLRYIAQRFGFGV
jgi:hypothetical protein